MNLTMSQTVYERAEPALLPRRILTLALFALLVCAAVAAAARDAHAQSNTGKSGVVISQIYARGGESDAAFRNDFVEIHNAGTAVVDLADWRLAITGTVGSAVGTTEVNFFGGEHIPLEPGRYYLVKLASSGTNGAALPTPNLDPTFPGLFLDFLNLRADGARVALVRRGATSPRENPCPALPLDGVEDYVGFGAAACAEGASAAAPGLTTALKRRAEGCVDTDDNASDFEVLAAAPRTLNSAPAPCNFDVPPSFFNFAFTSFFGVEGFGSNARVTVNRTGDLSTAATVEYEVKPNTASERGDYTTAAGRLRFAPGEAQKTFDVLVTDDAFQEQDETADLLLARPTGPGASLGFYVRAALVIRDNDATPPTTNPIDASSVFVSQHYHDFLSREYDPSGFVFWRGEIESCDADAACREVKRNNVSAAFFLSIEFQRTGFLVHRLYRASLPETAARPRALPRYSEFIRDTQELARGVVVGRTGWEQTLEANTTAFLSEFVTRPEFAARYPAQLTPAEYVDKLNAQAGSPLAPSERDALVADLTSGAETRASVLRKVAENPEFTRRETNPAFVLMQYFGYLRRNPDDAPDADFAGYDFWLSKLEEFHGNYIEAEMVKAFLTSLEYRRRFAQ